MAFTPPDGIRLWLRPDSIVSGGDQQDVALWRSVEAELNHARQDTVSHRPIFYARAGSPNGHPYVKFTPTASPSSPGQCLNLPDFCSDFTAAEILAVLKADNDPALASPAGQYLWSFSSTGILSDYGITGSGNIVETFGLNAAGGVGANPALALTSWRLYNVRREIDDLNVYLDDVLLYSNPGVGACSFPAAPSIGGNQDANSWFSGGIAEILMFNRVLTADERTTILNYISPKFSLGLVAPGAAVGWDSSWSDAQTDDALNNHGYWTKQDANGKETEMAHLSDRRSHRPSRWW